MTEPADTPSAARGLDGLLRSARLAKVIGVYDGLGALLASQHAFDALWVSGLGVSAALGLPDASIASSSEFLAAARVVCRSTHLPVIADADSGFGDVNTLLHVMSEYRRAGVAAVCIEDKRFPKRNSFSGAGADALADPADFAATIAAVAQARTNGSPLLVARLESLVVGAGMDDALGRAELYVHAGADALLVHSCAGDAREVVEFGHRFRLFDAGTPLLGVPTSYPQVTHEVLERAGFGAVVYSNQVLRAFVAGAREVLAALAHSDSPAVVQDRLETMPSLLLLLGSDHISAQDLAHEQRSGANRRRP